MDPLAIIVAMARGRVIGRDNGLPWRVPEDMRYFVRVTTGHAVIMGRKTYESIGKPLRDRRNIVVSRRPDLRLPGCEVAHSLEQALRLAREGGDAEPIVIGGASLYAEALPMATRLYITEIDRDVEGGDAFFPPIDSCAFAEVERRPGQTPDVTFVTLERRPPPETQ